MKSIFSFQVVWKLSYQECLLVKLRYSFLFCFVFSLSLFYHNHNKNNTNCLFFFVFFFRIFYTFIFITDPERYQRAFINSFFSARNSSCSKIFKSNVINTLFLFPATLISVTSFYYNIIISYVLHFSNT